MLNHGFIKDTAATLLAFSLILEIYFALAMEKRLCLPSVSYSLALFMKYLKDKYIDFHGFTNKFCTVYFIVLFIKKSLNAVEIFME